MSLLANGVNELLRFADYRGRSTRTDLFAFWLVTFVVGAALLLLATVILEMLAFQGFPLTTSVNLIYEGLLTIPMIALFVRRLHDRGLSGWLVALCLPVAVQNIVADYYRLTGDFEAMLAEKNSMSHLVAAIPLLAVFIFLLLPGEEEANRYGPNPRYDRPGELA
jgi:uncharacterized membrane protein YhaH (DUF805 family)